jgi:hypothetical protein
LHPKYTISRFVDAAGTLFHKRPGAWFSINEITEIMKKLHEDRPLKGSEHLKIMVSNEAFNPQKVRDLLAYQEPKRPDYSKTETSKSIFSKKKGIVTQSRYSTVKD